MTTDLHRLLAAWAPGHPAARLVAAVGTALPSGGDPLEGAEALGGLGPMTPTGRVPGESAEPLAVACVMDAGAHFAAGALSARMALSLYDAHRNWDMGIGDLEDDQARDAVFRLLALGALALALSPGDPQEAALVLRESAAGRALLAWFCAVDVALAFSSADEPLGDGHVGDLVHLHADDVGQVDAGLLSDASAALAVVEALLVDLDAAACRYGQEVEALGEAVRSALPELARAGREGLQAEADGVPIYGALAARLVVEVFAIAVSREAAPAAPPPDALAPLRAALAEAEARLAALDAELAHALGEAAEVEAALDANTAAMARNRADRETRPAGVGASRQAELDDARAELEMVEAELAGWEPEDQPDGAALDALRDDLEQARRDLEDLVARWREAWDDALRALDEGQQALVEEIAWSDEAVQGNADARAALAGSRAVAEPAALDEARQRLAAVEEELARIELPEVPDDTLDAAAREREEAEAALARALGGRQEAWDEALGALERGREALLVAILDETRARLAAVEEELARIELPEVPDDTLDAAAREREEAEAALARALREREAAWDEALEALDYARSVVEDEIVRVEDALALNRAERASLGDLRPSPARRARDAAALRLAQVEAELPGPSAPVVDEERLDACASALRAAQTDLLGSEADLAEARAAQEQAEARRGALEAEVADLRRRLAEARQAATAEATEEPVTAPRPRPPPPPPGLRTATVREAPRLPRRARSPSAMGGGTSTSAEALLARIRGETPPPPPSPPAADAATVLLTRQDMEDARRSLLEPDEDEDTDDEATDPEAAATVILRRPSPREKTDGAKVERWTPPTKPRR